MGADLQQLEQARREADRATAQLKRVEQDRELLRARVAALVVLMRVVDVFWLTQPAFAGSKFRLHWMDFLAPIGVGGLWLAVFLWQLGKRPLLPANDPELRQAVAHD